MNFKFISIFYIILSILCNAENPKVLLETSQGNVTLELNQDKAPLTVKNFISYIEKKFYDNTVFHRVIDDFMIQGGGFSNEDPPTQKKPESPIKNEGKKSGLSNIRGSIAMARTNDPDSATSQFFINVVDNSKGLDPGGYSPEGYAVFGKVIKGMDVVDKIKKVKTGTSRLKTLSGVGAMRDVPVDKVIIKTAKVIKSK